MIPPPLTGQPVRGRASVKGPARSSAPPFIGPTEARSSVGGPSPGPDCRKMRQVVGDNRPDAVQGGRSGRRSWRSPDHDPQPRSLDQHTEVVNTSRQMFSKRMRHKQINHRKRRSPHPLAQSCPGSNTLVCDSICSRSPTCRNYFHPEKHTVMNTHRRDIRKLSPLLECSGNSLMSDDHSSDDRNIRNRIALRK